MCDQKDLINTLFKLDCLFSCCFKGVRERSLGTVCLVCVLGNDNQQKGKHTSNEFIIANV